MTTTQEIQKKWDRFSSTFQYNFEPQTLPTAHVLVANLRLNIRNLPVPRAVLEVACGAGSGTKFCLDSKHPNTHLTAIDLSHDMLSLAKARLNVPQETGEDTQRHIKLLQANAEELPFADGAFDRYFSNYCLHLVLNPNVMLSECYRVLEKGGIATFSVWGRPQNSNTFTIIKKVLDELGFCQPSQPSDAPAPRTPFHLNDIELLKSMAKEAGFSKYYAAYTYFNTLVLSGQEYVDMFFAGPDTTDTIARLGQEKGDLWKQKVAEYVDALLAKGELIGLESAYLICVK
ncbi:hypothetical protein SAMD00019534_025710 [Acytostelium subglobosum LB1]|uniref:hypothetical protein n=1 Tax=Acytostelium subglobosum LB1 TaxID=1410327 RepID=UPI000644F5E1|nr:hypothetical protein SAMD00019534_025710 [Acytostelium subglobosum LB1]GAM19396.1 hypothetical protein SAMD00019534_025710 [Acytostelium subglobosum LB1]|eukprot:XP_012757323.1 hypothetical protein SAMD00019534_025710 [Acytostelium subglobosum LB1]